MTDTTTSTVQQGGETSTAAWDLATLMTMMQLSNRNHAQDTPSTPTPRRSWEQWSVIIAVFGAIVAGIVYFFITVIDIKEDISKLQALNSVLANEQTNLKSSIEKTEKSLGKIETLIVDVAVLKTNQRPNEKTEK